MKMKRKRILKLLTLFTLFYLFSQFVMQTKKEGIFKTVEDFTKGEPSYVGEYKNLSHAGANYTLSFKKGEEEIKYKLNEADFWGFRNERGEDFRVAPVIKSEKNKYPYKIVSAGKISYYGGYSSRITKKGEETFLVTAGEPSYLSQGINGDIYYFSFKELKKLLADDPVLLEKFNKKNSDYVNIIMEYNAKHK